VAASTGLRIDTLPQNKATLNIGNLNVPLVEQAGATCVVTIKNRCPACEGVRETINNLKLRPVVDSLVDVLKHLSFSHSSEEIEAKLPEDQPSDFPLYYHAFDVKIRGQFDFEPIIVERTYPPAVCYAVSGSETTDI
jgi:hypothetical protein